MANFKIKSAPRPVSVGENKPKNAEYTSYSSVGGKSLLSLHEEVAKEFLQETARKNIDKPYRDEIVSGPIIFYISYDQYNNISIIYDFEVKYSQNMIDNVIPEYNARKQAEYEKWKLDNADAIEKELKRREAAEKEERKEILEKKLNRLEKESKKVREELHSFKS